MTRTKFVNRSDKNALSTYLDWANKKFLGAQALKEIMERTEGRLGNEMPAVSVHLDHSEGEAELHELCQIDGFLAGARQKKMYPHSAYVAEHRILVVGESARAVQEMVDIVSTQNEGNVTELYPSPEHHEEERLSLATA